MTEAAQENPGGLERSSYTWQVRHAFYVIKRPKCQVKCNVAEKPRLRR